MARNEAVGKARYELETDPTKLKKGLDDAGRTIKATGAATEKAFAQQGTSALSRFGLGLDGVVKKFNDMSQKGGLVGALVGGAGMGVGLSAFNLVQSAVGTVLDNVGRAIDLASDKAEAASKANVLFGDSFHIIEDASRSAATTVGMSSGAYLTAAGNLGNLITNFGITGDAGAEMSKQLVQLAADMGSFNNASTQEVTEAMGSAFVGETEPIRRFGVMLSAADIAARAVALGLAKSTSAVSQAAKVQATYSLILEQTSKAQGDFERTADGKANADRIRAARTEEALTKLGEVITPLYQAAMPLLAEATTFVIEGLTALGATVAPLVDGALQAIATAIDVVGRSFTALKELMDPTGTEAEELTRSIVDQAEALGLSGDAVIAYTERVKARRAAELEAERTAAELAETERMIAQLIADSTAVTDAYAQAVKDGANEEYINNLIMQEKLDLNGRLNPYLEDRNRLTGELGIKQLEVNRVETDSARITGMAAEAVKAYQEELERLARQQAGVEAMYPPLNRAVEGSSEVFSRAASAANLSFGSVLLAAEVAMDRMPKAVEEGVGSAADAFAELGPTIRERSDAVREDVRAVMRAIRLDIVSPFRDIDDALWIESRLGSRAIQRGLNSSDPQIRADTRARVAFMKQQQDELVDVSRIKSMLASKAMERGLNSQDPEIRAKWRARKQYGLARLREVQEEAGTLGSGTTTAYAEGLDAPSALAAISTGLDTVAGVVRSFFKLSSPAKEGPLSERGGPEGWATDMVQKMARGARAGIPALAQAMGDVAGVATMGGPMLAGFSLTGSAQQTLRVEGRVEVALSGSTIAAAREQGASWDDLARMAAAASSVGDLLSQAQRTAGTRYLGPVGGTI
jgi:DNA-binding ferritin-like protein